MLFSIKCQWLVPKFEWKVYRNGKNRSSKHSVSRQFVLQQFLVFPEHCEFCLCKVLTHCHRYAPYAENDAQ